MVEERGSGNTTQTTLTHVANLSLSEEKIVKVCDIYSEVMGVSLLILGDIFYALGLNIDKKVCTQLGQVEKEGRFFVQHTEIINKVWYSLLARSEF